VLLMAQFGVRTVQPVVTLFVEEMVGARPDLATLSGIAFSATGLANVISAPLLGDRSDVIGYRRVLLICLLGATLTTLPQAFTENYLDLHRRALRDRAIHWRHFADRQCGGRAACPASRTRHGLRHHRVGDVSRQLIGATDRRRRRGRVWTALSVPRHRGSAVGEPRMGILPGARIRGPERLNAGWSRPT